MVLGQQEDLGLFDDIAKIGNEVSTLGREVLGRIGEEPMGESAIESDIDLFILRKSTRVRTSITNHHHEKESITHRWNLAVGESCCRKTMMSVVCEGHKLRERREHDGINGDG